MAEPSLPVAAYQFGKPIAEYRLDRTRVLGIITFLLLLGTAFFAGGIWWATHSPPSFNMSQLWLGMLIGGGVLATTSFFQWLKRRKEKSLDPMQGPNPAGKMATLSLGFVGIGLFFVMTSFYPPSMALGGGLMLLAVVVYIVYQLVRDGEVAALVFEKGMTYVKRGEVTALEWRDIGSLWTFLSSNTATVVLERASDNKAIPIDPRLKNVGELAEAIANRVIEVMLPRLIERYESGSPVQFGPLEITKTHVRSAKHTLPWSEVTDFSFDDNGILRLGPRSKHKFPDVHVNTIPNLPVLLKFVAQTQHLTALSQQ